MFKNSLKISLIGGFLASTICLSYFILLDILSQNPFGKYKYLYIGIYGLSFVGTFKTFRDKYNNSILNPQEAILLGFFLSIISSAFLGIKVYFFLYFSKNAFQKYKEESLFLLKKTKESFIQYYDIVQHEKLVQDITDLPIQTLALDQALGMLLTGFVLTFIFTLIFKKLS